MNASLYGLFVHNPEHSLKQSEALYINICEQLCQDFRREFLQMSSFDIATTIAQVAKTQRITQVMLGKTHKSFWNTLFHRSIVEQLISDVHPAIVLTQQAIDCQDYKPLNKPNP